jgi:hypothetical protein
MLMRTLVTSVAAALLGPAIGIGVFIMANRDHSGGQPTSISMTQTREAGSAIETGQAEEEIRTFTPQGRWLGSPATGMQEPKLKTAAVRPSREQATWHTVVTCPSGEPFPGDGICPLPEPVTTRPTGKSSTVNVPPEAGNLGSGWTDVAERAPPSPLPGRLSVGGP